MRPTIRTITLGNPADVPLYVAGLKSRHACVRRIDGSISNAGLFGPSRMTPEYDLALGCVLVIENSYRLAPHVRDALDKHGGPSDVVLIRTLDDPPPAPPRRKHR